MFVKTTNGQAEKYPYTIGEFRKAHPNKSFPKDIPLSVLETHGVFVIKETQLSPVDKKTHTYSWEVQLVDDVWTQVWSITQLPEETAAKNVRQHRDQLLSSSDWTQGKDIPEATSAPWAVYRQALRDLPAQEGFPYLITWPPKPSS